MTPLPEMECILLPAGALQMMFTSAPRSDDAEISSDAFIAEIDSTAGAVPSVVRRLADEGGGGAIFFDTTFGAGAACTEVVAVEFVIGSVEEAICITTVEVETVALPKKVATKMPRASAATIPR